MSHKILFVDSYYFDVVRLLSLDRATPDRSYASMLETASDFGFGTAGAYTSGFRKLGWDADFVIPNAPALQIAWMREHRRRPPVNVGWKRAQLLARVPLVRSALHRLPYVQHGLLEQVRQIRPDVLYVQDINLVTPALGRCLRKYSGLLVGEIASPLPPDGVLRSFDLIVSALPTIVDHARSLGMESEYVPLGFDPRWAGTAPTSERSIDVAFVGNFTRLQPSTVPLLRSVAEHVPGLQIYGPVKHDVLSAAGLTEYYRGEAWGRKMFEVLGDTKIVVNRHGSIAGDFAVNMRMYEATGCGAALVTERKQNLGDLFDIQNEVIPYDDVSEVGGLVASLLQDQAKLTRIAAAGQRRTLADHAYDRRAQRLERVLSEHPRA